MTDYLLLFVGTVLVNNFVLVKFLGLCPFMGVSKKLETAMGMGLATTFVMTLASICAWLIDTWILIPLNLIYLRTLAFILVIAVVVQFTEMVVRKTSPALYRLLGIFLPLITTNCAVLGVALLNINLGHNFLQSALYGFSAAVGFSLVMVFWGTPHDVLPLKMIRSWRKLMKFSRKASVASAAIRAVILMLKRSGLRVKKLTVAPPAAKR